MFAKVLIVCCLVVVVAADGNESGQNKGKKYGTKTRRQDTTEQKAIGEDDLPFELEDGSPCKFNFHCQSGCCLIGPDHRRRCSPKATFRQLCETSQIKGGVYDQFCPCQNGDSFCVRNRLTTGFTCSA